MNRPQGMPCPIDGAQLVMSERQGIEIDYCPTCRGVWLDRGELDKIIEGSKAEHAAPAPQAQAPYPPQAQAPYPPQQPHVQAPYQPHDPRYGHGHGYKQKRRKSFIEELFD